MKAKYLFFILIFFVAINGCKKKDEINPDNFKVPVIEFALPEQPADLNKIDNLPAVGVVTSELGLKLVKLFVVVGTEKKLYKEVSSFFNKNSYSFAEKFDYSPDYKDLIVEAIDMADRSVTATLHFQITEVIDPPVIVFDPAKITFDELNPTPIPNTKFNISSVAGLKNLEITLITETAQVPWGFPIDFTNAPQDYEFDTFIDYKAGNIGLRVKATDVYGQVKIVTLPIEYNVVPPPVVILGKELFVVESPGNVGVPIKVQSVAGVKQINVFKVEGGVETLLKSNSYTGDNDLDISIDIPFSVTMQGIKVAVTDKAGKVVTKTAKAIVGLKYVADYVVGSHRFTAGIAEYPGVYSLFSINDMKGYAIDNVLGQTENNIDIKFYMFGAAAVPRFYSIDGGTGTKSNEFIGKNGSVMNFSTANATRFLKLPATFDFDNATVADIQAIAPSLITSNNINPAEPGNVIAFKTGPTSTAGANKVGIIKLIRVDKASTTVADQGTMTISVKFLKN